VCTGLVALGFIINKNH